MLSFTAFSCTKRYIVVIHGGAGTLQKDMPPELEQQYKEKLKEALYKAYEKLQQGQTAIEAVEAAIVVMEDSPLFNAGKVLFSPAMEKMSWMHLLCMVRIKLLVL